MRGSFEPEGGTAGDQREIDHDRLAAIRAKAAERLEELREEIDRINEELEQAPADLTLPPVEEPEPDVELDSERHALVYFDDDWVTATRKLINRKAYSKKTKT
jgi:hypothetical protein